MNEESKKTAHDLNLHIDDSSNIELVEENLKRTAQENSAKIAEIEAEQTRAAAAKPAVNKEVADELHTESQMKTLRSFQGDVADAIEKQKTSLIKIKMAEEKKRESEKPLSSQGSGAAYGIKAIILVLSILLILAAGTIFAVTQYFARNTPKTAAIVYDTLIPFDSSEKLNVTNKSRTDILNAFSKLRGERIETSTIKYLKLSDGPIGESIISTSKFLNLLGTKAPPELVRSFSDTFMAGGFGAKSTEPFILIHIDSFDNAYSGMLAWENTMMDDIGPLFTSEHGAFEDLVVDNRDTRAVQDSHGATIFLYSFIDHNILLITTNETAFKGIIDKLVASKLIR